MSSDARAIRQYAELVKAGHRIEIPEKQFSQSTQETLALFLKVTNLTGGQVALALDRLATLLSTRQQQHTELELAVAGPKASSRLVISLPILVFLGSGIAGVPVFSTLVKPSVVWLSVILGGTLFWLGNRWTNRILKAAEPNLRDPGLGLELVAIATSAGYSLAAAADAVEPLIGQVELDDLPEIARGTGIAVSELLVERANMLRLEQFNQDRQKIQKTSVTVLWPLGLTVLPAFVLIAIVPVGASMI